MKRIMKARSISLVVYSRRINSNSGERFAIMSWRHHSTFLSMLNDTFSEFPLETNSFIRTYNIDIYYGRRLSVRFRGACETM